MLALLFHCTLLTKCQEKRKRWDDGNRVGHRAPPTSVSRALCDTPQYSNPEFYPNLTQEQKGDEELCFKRNTETTMPRSHILQKSHPWKPLLGWLSSSPWRQTLAAFSRYRWKIWGYSLYLSLKKKGHESTLPKLQLFQLLSYPQHEALRKLNLV